MGKEPQTHIDVHLFPTVTVMPVSVARCVCCDDANRLLTDRDVFRFRLLPTTENYLCAAIFKVPNNILYIGSNVSSSDALGQQPDVTLMFESMHSHRTKLAGLIHPFLN